MLSRIELRFTSSPAINHLGWHHPAALGGRCHNSQPQAPLDRDVLSHPPILAKTGHVEGVLERGHHILPSIISLKPRIVADQERTGLHGL